MKHFERSRSVISWVLILAFSLSQIFNDAPNAYAVKPPSTLQEEEGEEYVEALAASLGKEEEGLPTVELHRRLEKVSAQPMATAASLGEEVADAVEELEEARVVAIDLRRDLAELGYELVVEEVPSIRAENLPHREGVNVAQFLGGVPGLELLGVMADKDRITDTNFIYLLSGESVFAAADTPDRVFVDYGVVMTGDKIVYGYFDPPLPVHSFIHAGLSMKSSSRDFFESRGIPLLNSTDHMKLTGDKVIFKDFMQRHSIPTPAAAVVTQDMELSDIRKRLQGFIKEEGAQGIVVKPSTGSHGTGVRMFDTEEMDAVMGHIEKLQAKNEKLLIEARIPSRSWIKDGERMDWNLRVLSTWDGDDPITVEELIEVRFAPFSEKAVSASGRAEVITLTDFFDQQGYEASQRQEFLQKVSELVTKGAQEIRRETGSQPGLLGWDLMQSESGDFYVIESNSGSVGGVKTLEKLYRESLQQGDVVAPIGEHLREMAELYRIANPDLDLDRVKRGERMGLVEDATLLTNIGNVYGRNEKHLKAESFFRRAIEIDPNNDFALESLGVSLSKQGRFTEAEQFYHRALEINPDDVSTLVNFGQSLEDQRKHEEAEPILRRALESEPDNVRALDILGKVLSSQFKLAEAASLFHRALEIDPNNMNVLVSLGMTRVFESKFAEAEPLFHRALEIDPDNKMILELFYATLLALDKHEEAEEVQKRIAAASLGEEGGETAENKVNNNQKRFIEAGKAMLIANTEESFRKAESAFNNLIEEVRQEWVSATLGPADDLDLEEDLKLGTRQFIAKDNVKNQLFSKAIAGSVFSHLAKRPNRVVIDKLRKRKKLVSLFKLPFTLNQLKSLLRVRHEYSFNLYSDNNNNSYLLVTLGSELHRVVGAGIRAAAPTSLTSLYRQYDGHSHPLNSTADASQVDEEAAKNLEFDGTPSFILSLVADEVQLSVFQLGDPAHDVIKDQADIREWLTEFGILKKVKGASLGERERLTEKLLDLAEQARAASGELRQGNYLFLEGEAEEAWEGLQKIIPSPMPEKADTIADHYFKMLIAVALAFPIGPDTGASSVSSLARVTIHIFDDIKSQDTFIPLLTEHLTSLDPSTFNQLKLGAMVVTRPFENFSQLKRLQQRYPNSEITFEVIGEKDSANKILAISLIESAIPVPRLSPRTVSLGHSYGIDDDLLTASAYDTTNVERSMFGSIFGMGTSTNFVLKFKTNGNAELGVYSPEKEEWIYEREDQDTIEIILRDIGVIAAEGASLGQTEVNQLLDSVKARRKPIFALWSHKDYKNLTSAQLDEIKKLALWYPKVLKIRIYGADPEMIGTVDRIVFTDAMPDELKDEIGKNTTIA